MFSLSKTIDILIKHKERNETGTFSQKKKSALVLWDLELEYVLLVSRWGYNFFSISDFVFH